MVTFALTVVYEPLQSLVQKVITVLTQTPNFLVNLDTIALKDRLNSCTVAMELTNIKRTKVHAMTALEDSSVHEMRLTMQTFWTNLQIVLLASTVPQPPQIQSLVTLAPSQRKGLWLHRVSVKTVPLENTVMELVQTMYLETVTQGITVSVKRL